MGTESLGCPGAAGEDRLGVGVRGGEEQWVWEEVRAGKVVRCVVRSN